MRGSGNFAGNRRRSGCSTRRISCRIIAARLFGIDHCRASGDIGGVEQTFDRHIDKVTVAQIFFTVGISQLHRLTDQEPAFGVVFAHFAHVETLQRSQNLQYRGCTR